MITDTNGNPLAGAHITATVAKGLRAKDAHDVSVTTVANGHFTIANVPVVNVVNNNGTTTGGALTISVEAPAVGSGYMSATVSVNPQAQVTSTETGDTATGEGNPQAIWFDHFNADAGTIELPGFVATITGTLRNAATGAPFAGFPLRAQFHDVEFDQCPGGNEGTQDCSENPNPATIVTYASGGTYLPDNQATGADGKFFFHNLPDNSCIFIYAPGLNFVGGNGQDFGGATCLSDTADEAAQISSLAISTSNDFVQLNAVFATGSPNGDGVNPVVVSVGNATFISGSCGTFTSAQGNTITVVFSEPVTLTGALGENPITVLIGAFPNFTFDDVTAATLGADNRTLTLTLADPIPNSSEVTVDIPLEDVVDLAGNPLGTANGVPFGSTVNTVINDTNGNGVCDAGETGCSVENSVAQFCFNAFTPGTEPGGDVTLTQISPVENSGVGVLLFDTTASLIDNVANNEPSPAVSAAGDRVCYGSIVTPDCDFSANFLDDEIEQFNANQTNPTAGFQLNALADALAPGGIFSPNVDVRIARVHVIANGNTNFAVADINPLTGQPQDVLFFPVRTAAGGGNPTNNGQVINGKEITVTTINNGGALWYSISTNGATEFDLVIADGNGVAGHRPVPGDIIAVIARAPQANGQFVLGDAAQVTLRDNVAPTVALQFLCPNIQFCANATAQATIFGQGGVVVTPIGEETGAVLLHITPQTGDTDETSTPDNGTAGGYYFDDFTDELQATSAAAEAGATPPNLYDSAGQLKADTDATGTDAYLVGGGSDDARIAIDIVERVTIGPGTPPAHPTGGASTLSDYVAFPSVNAENSNNCTISNDEVTFNVSKIVGEDALNGDQAPSLENDAKDHDPIDLTGAITDLANNTAAAANNAVVVTDDKFPPLVVEAFTDGLNTFIRFNEPILKEGHITFLGAAGGGGTCGGVQTVDLANDDVTLSNDGLVVVIPAQGTNAVFNPITPNNCFSPQTGPGSAFTYAEPIYTAALVNAIADAGGEDVSTTSFPAEFAHTQIDYSDVPDRARNIWDCTAGFGTVAGTGPGSVRPTISGVPGTYCGANVALGQPALGLPGPITPRFVWAGTQLGMAGPTFELANILGPFNLQFQAVGFNNGSASATFTISGTHPIGNWFVDQTNLPNPAAELFTDLDPLSGAATAFCTPGSGTLGVDAPVVCTSQFVTEWMALTSATCAIDPSNTRTNANLSADQKTLTIHVGCTQPGGQFTSGDTFQVTVNTTYAANAVGPFDTARSTLDGERQSPVSHMFTAP